MPESQKKSQIFQRKPNLNLFRESLNTCLFMLHIPGILRPYSDARTSTQNQGPRASPSLFPRYPQYQAIPSRKRHGRPPLRLVFNRHSGYVVDSRSVDTTQNVCFCSPYKNDSESTRDFCLHRREKFSQFCLKTRFSIFLNLTTEPSGSHPSMGPQ